MDKWYLDDLVGTLNTNNPSVTTVIVLPQDLEAGIGGSSTD